MPEEVLDGIDSALRGLEKTQENYTAEEYQSIKKAFEDDVEKAMDWLDAVLKG
jgi:hypothetical protein